MQFTVPLEDRKLSPERHYYTSNKLFEQSLDIYRPTAASVGRRKNSQDSSSSNAPTTVVVLVVGSAWLGHRSIIYSGTSWWNSSGPKAVAETGRLCVCIRHRGSFMKSYALLTSVFLYVMAALTTAVVHILLDDHLWELLDDVIGGRGIILVYVTGWMSIELGGIGAASFDDMQKDVMDALAWLHVNETRLGLDRHPTTNKRGGGTEHQQQQQQQAEWKNRRRRLFVFGGYSSGGHVAATVLQNPTLWTDQNLAKPRIHCDSILYISPVLATRAYDAILRAAPAFLWSPPSPIWLTGSVVRAVFGHVTGQVPSPIHTYDRSPRVPHVFIGCKNEMFGLTWLDTFFCSSDYNGLLNGMGIESRYRTVRSDHWNILSSAELKVVLGEELGRIERECRTKGNKAR